jgi:hypothetical protein
VALVEKVWNTMVVLCVITDTPVEYSVLGVFALGFWYGVEEGR